MGIADKNTYLRELCNMLLLQWPNNRTINIVCHGHSVPAGYSATPMVDTFNAYPHLLHKALKLRFPFAVINVIVSSIGGENSEEGSKRFREDVLNHKPDVVTIDYSLNDRGIGFERAKASWKSMIEMALHNNTKVILLTPTFDISREDPSFGNWKTLMEHAAQIRSLAEEYEVGLADSFIAFERYVNNTGNLSDLLSWPNHPSRKGHELVRDEITRWFPFVYM